jgi:hypothetical protein
MIAYTETKLVQGLPPVADAFSGTVYSDVINMKNWARVRFIRFDGVGATGTSTLTVEACDNTTPSTVSAIPFRYRETGAGTDVFGALTDATASGFTTTAGSNQIVEVWADAEALGASGYGFIRLKCVEVVDSPCLGGILVELHAPRYASDTDVTVIS